MRFRCPAYRVPYPPCQFEIQFSYRGFQQFSEHARTQSTRSKGAKGGEGGTHDVAAETTWAVQSPLPPQMYVVYVESQVADGARREKSEVQGLFVDECNHLTPLEAEETEERNSEG